jgi:hypothetical protein
MYGFQIPIQIKTECIAALQAKGCIDSYRAMIDEAAALKVKRTMPKGRAVLQRLDNFGNEMRLVKLAQADRIHDWLSASSRIGLSGTYYSSAGRSLANNGTSGENYCY